MTDYENDWQRRQRTSAKYVHYGLDEKTSRSTTADQKTLPSNNCKREGYRSLPRPRRR